MGCLRKERLDRQGGDEVYYCLFLFIYLLRYKKCFLSLLLCSIDLQKQQFLASITAAAAPRQPQ